MTLNGAEVYVLTGAMWRDFVGISGCTTADFAGVATGHPASCGDSVVVPLDGGLDGPGALVSDTARQTFTWLPADFWAAYASQGGPTGPLGPPATPSVDSAANGKRLQFSGGTINKQYGGATTVDLISTSSEAIAPLDLAACERIDIEQLVR